MGGSERVILEFEPGAEPITGTIGEAGGTMQAFAGYVELIAHLERLRAGTGAPDNVAAKHGTAADDGPAPSSPARQGAG